MNTLEQLFDLATQKIVDNPVFDMMCLDYLLKAYNGNDWKQYIANNKLNYSKHLVKSNELLDMYIITWPSKTESKVHDHPDFGCIMKILQGELYEDEYENNNGAKFIGTNHLTILNIGFKKGKNILHKIKNTSDCITISLHLYSRGGYKMNLYE